MPWTFMDSEDELRRVVKRPPRTILGKIDTGPLKSSPGEFLAATRLALFTTVDDNGFPKVMATAGSPGFMSQDPADGNVLVPIPEDHRDDININVTSRPFAGMLLVIPGVRHTLRVNGSATLRDGGAVLALAPDQSYAHCAKAFIRSELWKSDWSPVDPVLETDRTMPLDSIDEAAAEFLRRSPFAVLATSDISGDSDVSPRGDPPGFARIIDSNTLFVPERPGNRIADSLRNLLSTSKASLVFLVQGDERTLEVVGDAHITTDEKLCSAASVNGKRPKLGIVVKVHTARLNHEPALAESRAWDTATHTDDSELKTIGELLADPNGDATASGRLQAAVTDRLVNVDYKRRLY
jgi:PPOX class probable FMN-dependent enzyme